MGIQQLPERLFHVTDFDILRQLIGVGNSVIGIRPQRAS